MPRSTFLRWSVLASLLTGACSGPASQSPGDVAPPFDLEATRQRIAELNEHGKYLNVWQNVGGNWKIKSNMWNTNPPAPGTEPSG